MAGDNDDLYGDIFRAAMIWYANRQGTGSGDTPNFYNIPLTPEQKRVEDEKWNVYKAGGSPTQKTITGLGQQFLSGLQSSPSGFQFMSPELRGQAFAGGVKLPTFDFSKLPALGGTPTPTTPTKPPPPPGSSSQLRLAPNRGIQEKIAHEYIQDPQTKFDAAWNGDNPGPSDDSGLLFGHDTLPGGMQYADGTKLFESAQTWWDGFKQEHPDWVRMGATAVQAALAAYLGPLGNLAGGILRKLVLRDRGGQQPPPNIAAGPTVPLGGAPGNIMKP